MKEKILLIAGCSHSAGSEIDGKEDSAANRKNSFGGLIAKNLKRRPINISHVGATNSGIARQVINWFEKEYDPETMNVNVLALSSYPKKPSFALVPSCHLNSIPRSLLSSLAGV